MIYQPHMEKSDWSEFTTTVQVSVTNLHCNSGECVDR